MPGQPSLLLLGGAGRGSAERTLEDLERSGHPRTVPHLAVDAIADDPHTLCAPGVRHLTTDPKASEFVVLRIDEVTRLIEQLEGDETLDEFEFLQGYHDELARSVRTSNAGSGRMPPLAAIAVAHVDGAHIRARLRTFVDRARSCAGEGDPVFIVCAGLGAGGIGAGTLGRMTDLLRVHVGRSATLIVIGYFPGPWEGFDVDPIVQQRQEAKAVASVRALEPRIGNVIDFVYLVGTAPAPFAGVPPMQGVVAAAGSLNAELIRDLASFTSRAINWKAQQEDGHRFSTFGIVELTTAAPDQAHRTAHAAAEAGWHSVSRPAPADRARIQSLTETLLGGFSVCPELNDVRSTPRGETPVSLLPARHAALLASGDPASPPLPLPALAPPPRGSAPEDVRAFTEEYLAIDAGAVKGRIDANRVRAGEALCAQLDEQISAAFPHDGTPIADDPGRIRCHAGSTALTKDVLRRASLRVQDETDAFEARHGIVRAAEENLATALDHLSRRARRGQIKRVIEAVEHLAEARRWRMGAAGVATTYDALAHTVDRRVAEPLAGVMTAIGEFAEHEQSAHLASCARIADRAALPHVRLAAERNSLEEAAVDATVLREVKGDAVSVEQRALAHFRVSARVTDGRLRMVCLVPTEEGEAPTTDSYFDLPALDRGELSRIIATDAGGWSGTISAWARLTVADVLGIALTMEAADLGVRIEDHAAAFVASHIQDLQAAAGPLAELRASKAQGSELPEPSRSIVLDGREPHDAAGRLVQAQLVARDDCTISRTSLHAGRLVLTEHHHGLAPRQFADFERALAAYRNSTDPIHVEAPFALAHALEACGRETGIRPTEWMIDPRVIQKALVAPQVAKTAAQLLAAGRFDEVRPNPHGEPLVALRLSTSDLAKPVVLGPAGDPAAVIVEAVRNREVIWPELYRRLLDLEAELAEQLPFGRASLDEQLDHLLAKLRLSGTKADIDTDDLAVVLRLYPPSRRSLQPLGTSERLSQDALF